MSEPVDFYSLVPKDMGENIRFRMNLLQRCAKDDVVLEATMAACKHDVLFWMNAFCWVYEPRPRFAGKRQLPSDIPLITWKNQDPVVREMKEYLGKRDIGVEKCRGEGLSWIMILLALHDWLFEPASKVGLISRTEDEADDSENPDSLFWKIDFELTKLPRWMVGREGVDYVRNKTKHSLVNYRNKSARINADAATGNAFRGGRLRWALFDEFAFFKTNEDKAALASSQGATDCRVFVSTVNGTDNEYHRIMHEPSGMVRIVVDWRDNPTKNRGLYRIIDGHPVADDPRNPLPLNYQQMHGDVKDLFDRLRKKGFVLEGMTRSPWFDHECDRPGATPQQIAQELERDYGGSMAKVFGYDFFQTAERTACDPITVGDILFDQENLTPAFDRVRNGRLRLWTQIDHKHRPPPHQYVLGADVATGIGGTWSSNSVAVVIDVHTREQVAEFASNVIAPADFADLCIALCKWFHGAYLAWEQNGPGAAFCAQVLKRRYQHLYHRTTIDRKTKRRHKAVGWWSDDKTRETLFSDILTSVRRKDAAIRSRELLHECSQYVRIKGGKIEHVGAIDRKDMASNGKSHGDRVVAFGMAVTAMRDRPVWTAEGEEIRVMPDECPARRWSEYQDELRKKDAVWDDRGEHGTILQNL